MLLHFTFYNIFRTLHIYHASPPITIKRRNPLTYLSYDYFIRITQFIVPYTVLVQRMYAKIIEQGR